MERFWYFRNNMDYHYHDTFNRNCYLCLISSKNATFTLPIAWAYFGIYKELQTAGSYGTLEVIALINMALLIAMAVYVFVRNKNSILPILDRQTREV